MHRRHVYEDTTRVAVFIGGEFGIFTTDPHRLGELHVTYWQADGNLPDC